MAVVPVNVDRDKVTRAQAVAPLVEARKVLLPERAGWLDEPEEMSTFPSATDVDYVDCTAQALNYLRRTDDGDS